MKPQPKFSETHPSYGVISVARQSSSRTRLFGCSTTGYNCMSMTISEAALVRNSDTDAVWVHPQNHILEIVMSPLQLAELVSSANCGEGVPCTIAWRDGKYVPGPEHPTTRRELIEESFRKNMLLLSQGCDEILVEAQSLSVKTSVNKSDRAKFVTLAEGLVNQIKAATPYIMGQLADTVERMVAEIKTDAVTPTAPTHVAHIAPQ